MENTLLNIVARSGCFASPGLEKTLNSSPPTPPSGGYPTNLNGEASPRKNDDCRLGLDRPIVVVMMLTVATPGDRPCLFVASA